MVVSWKNLIFAEKFLKTADMMINHRLRLLSLVMMLFASLQVPAQTSECQDTAEHRRLQTAMWEACSQDSQKVVYDACLAFQKHAKKEGDMRSAHTAWICGIMFNLGKMNIQDAYHLTQLMKRDIEEEKSEEERYFVPNMMGHVYSTCGNIPGAKEEFLKSAEMIKGTRYEADELGFIYLALAHAELNNDLKESLHWIGEAKKELEIHKDSPNYYRCLSDVYAVEAIVSFKQGDNMGFRRDIAMMEVADKRNQMPTSDLFVPYARIYQTLMNGDIELAMLQTEKLGSKKECYLLKCDIYRYIGDNEKAILIQRELMHMRDSITGVMINENIHQQEQEMELMKQQQKMARRIYLILVHTVFLAILVIILMARNILMRRRYQKRLITKNQELREANKLVTAADEMKTEFIRSMSHEIRTPLNIINGFSQVLTDDENELEPEERRNIASTISENTRQITSLVNKMQALVNMNMDNQENMMKETDASDICQRAILTMPDTDPDIVKVVFDDQTNQDDQKLVTNPDSLLQMLSNLLENAVKFTELGQITLTLRHDDRNYYFTVTDTGCGIPEDKIPHIFERFTKGDEFKEGLGLGLAYCYETAEKLGGSLMLDNTSALGTAFTLSLPIKNNKQ